ncbi:MAG TPA: PIN domain-containing protein, partial [Gemmatimonadaceae bacterium]|nr:PIN domain-containing protein [Gemmatimonadaceae bacterium]
GFLLGGRAERNAAELREFLAHPLVEVVETDADTARIFAEIVVDLRRAGRPVPTNDIWIAASAARTAATVLTGDAHFRNIGRVGSIVVEPESKD